MTRTCALDLETARTLKQLARRWKVSPSEALRRAVQASASQSLPPTAVQAVRALERLQKALSLAPREANRWAAAIRAERRGVPRLSRNERRKRALRAIGRFRSAPSDLSRRHDAYLTKTSSED